MIIVPEIEAVVLLVPRTGTGSLRRAVAEAYPRSMLIYRHMEADGIPLGYDRWRRVGVVRNPLDRLWSLYKFLTDFGGQHDPAYIASMRRSVELPFGEWITENNVVFTQPYDSAGRGRYWPAFTVRHPLPENRKSQWLTLRPDLGTDVYRFDQLGELAARLGVGLKHEHNVTDKTPVPSIGMEAVDHLCRVFAWDYAAAAAEQRLAAAS